LDDAKPDRSRRSLFAAADRARTALHSGDLFPLRSLESQAVWLSRTDQAQVDLQYAQSHMAVRYLAEDFGAETVISIVVDVANGTALGNAIQKTTGLTYTVFEDRFVEYLGTWIDPAREGIGFYVDSLEKILDRQREITEQRSVLLGLPRAQRVGPATDLVTDAQALLSELTLVEPPAEMGRQHEETLSLLARIVDWLTLELEFAQTGQDSKRIEANQMIPEVNARTAMVSRGLLSAIFNYGIGD
jgi:hypothetical protein